MVIAYLQRKMEIDWAIFAEDIKITEGYFYKAIKEGVFTKDQIILSHL